jgi:hypothetical protein
VRFFSVIFLVSEHSVASQFRAFRVLETVLIAGNFLISLLLLTEAGQGRSAAWWPLLTLQPASSREDQPLPFCKVFETHFTNVITALHQKTLPHYQFKDLVYNKSVQGVDSEHFPHRTGLTKSWPLSD